MCLYIYIYIERERERKRENLPLNTIQSLICHRTQPIEQFFLKLVKKLKMIISKHVMRASQATNFKGGRQTVDLELLRIQKVYDLSPN